MSVMRLCLRNTSARERMVVTLHELHDWYLTSERDGRHDAKGEAVPPVVFLFVQRGGGTLKKGGVCERPIQRKEETRENTYLQ